MRQRRCGGAAWLAELLIPHAQEAFGMLGQDVADSDAMFMLRWIRSEGSRHSSGVRAGTEAASVRWRG